MSQERNSSLKRLAIIAGIVILAIALGYVLGEPELMWDILSAVGLLLICITILVTVHELGHFLPAKWFGIKVDVFSIGFPPRIFSYKKGETEYQIGATPLGGYVKIAGMIDESMDEDTIQKEKERERYRKGEIEIDPNNPPEWMPKPWEFRSKPVWQRLIVMTGGVIMNILLGIFIFSMMKFTYGDNRLPMSEAKYGLRIEEPFYSVEVDKKTGARDSTRIYPLGYMLGFRTGDELLTFRGEAFPFLDDYNDQSLLIEDDAWFTIRRNGQIDTIFIPGNVQNYFSSDTIQGIPFTPAVPSFIKVEDSINVSRDRENPQVIPAPAYEAGLRTGDRIVALDGMPVTRFFEISDFMKGKASQTILVAIERDGQRMDSIVVTSSPQGYLGVGTLPIDEIFQFDTVEYGFFESFGPGFWSAFGFLGTNVQGFRNLGREGVDVSRSVMGPLQIGKVLLETWKARGVAGILALTGMLSMILALVNILPIPALDGGHVVFLLIEGITRREPSPKVRIIAQQIGFILILGLMLLVFLNDGFRLFD
jgi:regulator of sigma E protease